MSFSSDKHGVFSCDVECDAAGHCQNTKCLYKQKTLGVHIWWMGDGPYDEVQKSQLKLREELGPWYQPEFKAVAGTNCHTIWCSDYIPPDKT